MANGLQAYTCNANDFAGIAGLEVVPVALADIVTPGESAT